MDIFNHLAYRNGGLGGNIWDDMSTQLNNDLDILMYK